MESAKIKTLSWRQQEGFSIVELLIAAAIGLIALGMVSTLYFTSNRSFTFGQTRLQSEADLRLAMDWITRDMRAAESLSPDTVTLTIPTDTVTIIIPLGDGSEDNINYDFSDSDNRLRRNQKPIAPVSMHLSRLSTTADTVTITLCSTTGDTNRTLTTKVTMRNAE